MEKAPDDESPGASSQRAIAVSMAALIASYRAENPSIRARASLLLCTRRTKVRQAARRAGERVIKCGKAWEERGSK